MAPDCGSSMRSRSASKLFECLCRPCIGKATLLRGNVGLELEALWTVDFVFILSLIFHHGPTFAAAIGVLITVCFCC